MTKRKLTAEELVKLGRLALLALEALKAEKAVRKAYNQKKWAEKKAEKAKAKAAGLL